MVFSRSGELACSHTSRSIGELRTRFTFLWRFWRSCFSATVTFDSIRVDMIKYLMSITRQTRCVEYIPVCIRCFVILLFFVWFSCSHVKSINSLFFLQSSFHFDMSSSTIVHRLSQKNISPLYISSLCVYFAITSRYQNCWPATQITKAAIRIAADSLASRWEIN